MDKHDDKSKKPAGICVLDSSEEDSDGENPWRAWMCRMQAERARRSRDAAQASSAPAPGPSGQSSSQRQSQSAPTSSERSQFWASISNPASTNTAVHNSRSTVSAVTSGIRDSNSGGPKDIIATLNKILKSASNVEKYKERYNREMNQPAASSHATPKSSPVSSIPHWFSQTYLDRDGFAPIKKKLDSRSRKRPHCETGVTTSHRPDTSDMSLPSTSGVKTQKDEHKTSPQPCRLVSDHIVSGSRVNQVPIVAPSTIGQGSPPEKVRKISPNDSTPESAGSAESLAEVFNATVSDNMTVSLEDIELPEPSTLASDPEPEAKKNTEDALENKCSDQTESRAAQTVESVDLQLNHSLLSLLECPVCLEWMEPPMVQCRRGHLVCRLCRGRMPRCPVCRASFTSVRNRAMEQVAEKLRYPCRHACGAVVLLRLRTRHEASCLRRSYACPLPPCADVAPMSHAALLQHHREHHAELVFVGNNHTFQVNVCTNQQKDWMMFAHDQLFHVHFTADSRNWGLNASVTYVGPKRNAKKYVYEISTAGTQNARKLVYTRETHSDLDVRSSNYVRGDAFFIPIDHALNFIRPERHTLLSFNVAVLKSRTDDNQRDSGETS